MSWCGGRAIPHDVGKIGVPDEILNKPGKLNEGEWLMMKKHPAIGARILTAVDSYSSMIDKRVYRPAMPREEMLAELRRCSGTQFDPWSSGCFSSCWRGV